MGTKKFSRLKQWILSIVNPSLLCDEKEGKIIKLKFLIYFDGPYGIDYEEDRDSTYSMGVCKLEYKKGTLSVYLRKPGLLIGEKGHTIDALQKHLGCKIHIVEVSLLK